MRRLSPCLAMILLVASTSFAAPWGTKTGAPALKSAGPLAFGPDGVLFVGDTKSATIFAIDTGDSGGDPSEVELHVLGLDQKIAKLLKRDTQGVTINDLAINPQSGNAYVSVAYGEQGKPALFQVLPNGEINAVVLKDINFSKVALPNPPEDRVTGQGRRRSNRRDQSITDIAFSDGRLLVSGLSSDDTSSNVREILFPFEDADRGTSLEIYHGAHGRFEDNTVVRAFVPFVIDGEPHLLAGFQCTPLVKFPLSALDPGKRITGTTVAELGNRNRPYDMIVYEKDGKDYLLMANSARGVMKISTDDIERQDGITERIGGTAGQSYDTIEDLKDVVQLDRLNAENAVIVVQNGSQLDLHTVPLP